MLQVIAIESDQHWEGHKRKQSFEGLAKEPRPSSPLLRPPLAAANPVAVQRRDNTADMHSAGHNL